MFHIPDTDANFLKALGNKERFFSHCGGEAGNMIYITDIKTDEKRGHGIAEVVVFEAGQSKFRVSLEYSIFGEGSQISTNQKRERTVFSLLIG